ncbi:MAG TPA: sodium:proton antiporter, partial [Pirellulales bacterium]|nr:sodium:proton antiporter [Pirellulales bacterium]
KGAPPPGWTVVPFVLLLGAIAVFPLIHATEHWWEENRNKFLVAAGLGALTLAYYGLLHAEPIQRHFLGHAVVGRSAPVFDFGLPATIFANAILQEYVPFIILLFSLYTISGGIRIEGDLPAHPGTNTAFIGVGALLASFIGTTGAAMLLIRPLLETNSERKHVKHTVVFFIFAVCNCGGCLLPLGDPPLFLGYLQGVDFLWTLQLWQPWLAVNCALLAIYFAWDRFVCYPREQLRDRLVDETRRRPLRFYGLWPNALLLLGVVLSVALLDTSKTIPGTDWHPWLYLRECVLLGLVAASLALGKQSVREANRFNYVAIVEVAALFVGIFICMQPALQILDLEGPNLGINSPGKFFWITGALSSVLDNAPTYLVFFETARALHADGAVSMPHVGIPDRLLAAISLGAVFMGANTYIGNGPNFMVKTIAEKSGVRMPSFFGYMLYSGCVLIPLFIAVHFLFFWLP